MKTTASDRGAALVLALVAVALLSAVGVAMLFTSSSEVLIAGAFHDQREGIYAADAIVARALDEIGAFADWSALLAGARSPTLVDGPPSGTRTLADGSTIDLQRVVNMANCQKTTACTVAELDAVNERRPWGARNPRWQLYAYGTLGSLLPPGAAGPPWYVVLLVADDPLMSDTMIVLRAEAFGPRNAHAAVELLAGRSGHTDYNEGPVPVNILSWREVR